MKKPTPHSTCLDTIQAAARMLVQAGFTAAISTTGELTSAFLVESGPLHFLYKATCIGDEILIETRISGLERLLGKGRERRKQRIYEELLRAAGRHKISIGIQDASITLSFCKPYPARNAKPITETFTFAATLAVWLHNQLSKDAKDEAIEPFVW